MNWDAEGIESEDVCPNCASRDTITYVYIEGYSEIECRACGHMSELQDIAELTRYPGDLAEAPMREGRLPPIPVKKLKA